MPSLFVKYWKEILSIALSILVLMLFLQDANQEILTDLFGQIHWGWLGVAFVAKAISLSIHEYRLWVGFPYPRPPIQDTMQIGFSSAVINIVAPGRAGDVAAIAMLHKRCAIPVGIATYAVGIVSFFEGAIFGLMMLAVLLLQSQQWIQYLGTDIHTESINTITGLTLLGILIVVIAAIIGRRLTDAPSEDSDSDFSPLVWIRDTFNQTGHTLTKPRYILVNSIASLLEVWLMIAAFAMGFWILPLESNLIEMTGLMAWSLSGLVLGISAISAIVLPPTYGAGNAAASIFILGLFGFDENNALAFAAIWWLISQVPTVILGLPSLWFISHSSGTFHAERS